LDDETRRLAESLKRIYRKLDLYKDEFMQVSPKEQLLLLLVEESGPTRVKDLADKTGLPLSTVSWTADKMVGKGFFKRGSDDRDRRAVILELDRKGKKQVAKYHVLFTTIAEAAAGRLDKNEFKNILSIIEKIAETI